MRDIAKGLGVLVLFVAMLSVGAAFLHQPIESGQYTGRVMEVEYETGLVVQTTTTYLKTGPESSRFESLCVPNAPTNPLTAQLREAARNRIAVTVTYDTPLIVPPWDCSTTPVLRGVTPSP